MKEEENLSSFQNILLNKTAAKATKNPRVFNKQEFIFEIYFFPLE